MTDFQKTMDFYHQISIPRNTGTEGSEKVAQLIQETWQTESQAKVMTQEFTVTNGFMGGVLNLIHPIIGIILIITFLLTLAQIYLAALIMNIILLISAFFSRQIISLLQYPSQTWGKPLQAKNIIAEITPKEPITKNLVILAHHDSQSHRLSPIFEGIGYAMGFIFAVFYAIHNLILLIIAISNSSPINNPWQLGWGLFVGIFAMVEVLNTKGNASIGVIDNASGVVAGYMVLKTLQDKPLTNTRVLVIATGAEEMGDYGTHWFLKTNEFNLNPENTQFLVIDSIGVPSQQGQNVILVGEGLPKFHYSPKLEPLVDNLLAQDSFPLKIQWIPPGLQIQTDLVPVIRAGFQGLTIATNCFKFHSASDNWDLFDERIFKEIGIFIDKLIRSFDQNS
jgi:hypothetical protein